MKRITVVVLIVLLCSFKLSQAEPTPAIRYLMNEPVSMLDFGIWKLQMHINQRIMNREDPFRLLFLIGNTLPSVGAGYSWELNRINFTFYYVLPDKYFQPKSLKKKGKDIIDRLKSHFFKHSYIVFSHAGYESRNAPKNISEELNNITEIKIVFTSTREQLVFKLEGKSSFLEKNIRWSNVTKEPLFKEKTEVK